MKRVKRLVSYRWQHERLDLTCRNKPHINDFPYRLLNHPVSSRRSVSSGVAPAQESQRENVEASIEEKEKPHKHHGKATYATLPHMAAVAIKTKSPVQQRADNRLGIWGGSALSWCDRSSG